MGLGPNGSSLLHKLGLLKAHEIPFEDFVSLIKAEQTRRTLARAMGRLVRMNKDRSANSNANPRKPKQQTLEALGFNPVLCEAMRKQGKTDSQIIQILKQKGLV